MSYGPRLSLLLLCLFSAGMVRADTYQVTRLHSDQGYSFYGFDDLGNATIYNNSCIQSPNGCYYNFFNGVSTGETFSAPTFVANNGTPCAPVEAGPRILGGVCNGGREAFSAYLVPDSFRPSVYTGPSPLQLVAGGGSRSIFLNGVGDVIWDDEFSDNFYEALDLTTRVTPEPSTFVLCGTGLIGLMSAIGVRRREQRQNESS